jgi:curved DNA binding protein
MSKIDAMEVEGQKQPGLDENLDNQEVLVKYREAGKIANEAIAFLMRNVAPNKKVVELCQMADAFIAERVQKVYAKKKDMKKGVAFPTCVNVNNIVCHYSPLEDDTLTLKEGDQVRFDVGVHIDGYIAVAAHTVVLTNEVLAGKVADALAAAYTAVEVASRLIKPGRTNTEITKALDVVAKEFDVSLAEGVLSHQMKRWVIDGNKSIILRATPEHNVPEITFEDYEVYSLDVVVHTGNGKLRETTHRPNVFKREPENRYMLKRQTSKQALAEIVKKFDTLPFTLRNLDKKSRIGMNELLQTRLVDKYPVLTQRDGEFVAHIKTTFLLLPTKVEKVTGLPLQKYNSEKKLTDPNLLKLLQTSLKTKKKKKKEAKQTEKKEDDAMDTSL